MRTPQGTAPAAATKAQAETQIALVGSDREALLPRLRVVMESPEGEVLLEDDQGQPWVDRPHRTFEVVSAQRELAQVSWREVCFNWPEAMCPAEAGLSDDA
ncbi:MAG TPA: hypothetical protein VHN99_02815 [Deinococcales bacterium]|nr:hypothetical protein [Deinococcales bacterium]